MYKPTLEQAKADLERTNQDIKAIETILQGLYSFTASQEDAPFLPQDRIRYERYKQEGLRCKATIEKFIKANEHPT